MCENQPEPKLSLHSKNLARTKTQQQTDTENLNIPEFFKRKHDLVRDNFLRLYGSLFGTEDNHLVSQMVQSAEKRGGVSTPPNILK
jgi:hypothetical protein